MAAIIRNLSDDWKVTISLCEKFGIAVGVPKRRYEVNILDCNRYNDPGQRTVWYKSLDELKKLRDALSDFINLAENETINNE